MNITVGAVEVPGKTEGLSDRLVLIDEVDCSLSVPVQKGLFDILDDPRLSLGRETDPVLDHLEVAFAFMQETDISLLFEVLFDLLSGKISGDGYGKTYYQAVSPMCALSAA